MMLDPVTRYRVWEWLDDYVKHTCNGIGAMRSESAAADLFRRILEEDENDGTAEVDDRGRAGGNSAQGNAGTPGC